MSRKAVQVGVLAVFVVGAAALALRDQLGISRWFGSAGGPDASSPPSELGADATSAGREGAAGAGTARGADREGVLASRHVERRGVGGLHARVVRAGGGAGVEGAAVEVSGVGHGGEEVRVTATTDPKGDARFESVAAGQGYVVRVTVRGEPPVDLPDIEVRAGRDRDLGLIEVGATQALTGRVIEAGGKPVAGADVRVLSGFDSLLDVIGNMAEMFGTLGREPTPIARATTGDDGRFRLEGLPPGPLVLVAAAPGRRQTVERIRMTPKGPAAGEPTLVLQAGGVIAGQVVDALGAPVAAARLALIEADDNDPSSFLTRRTFTVSDGEGRFRARVDESVREVRAIVEARGFPMTFSGALKAGQDDARIVLVGGATVEVRVEDEAHKGVEGAQVAMGVERGDMNAPDGVGGFLYGSTDASGVVTFASGPGNVAMVIVNHRDFAGVMEAPRVERRMGGAKDDPEIPREIKADTTTKILIRLHHGITIRGRVLDSHGSPIAGVEVRSIGSMGFGGGTTARSGADGTYRVTGGAAGDDGMGASTAILARAPGWHQSQTSMQVDASKAKDGEIVHDITLTASAVVRGKVLDADGSPVAGAEVRVVGGDFNVMDMIGGGGTLPVTGADGSYEIRDVGPSEASDVPAMPSAAVEAGGGDTKAPAPAAPRVAPSHVSVTAQGRVPADSEPFTIGEGATVDVPVIRMSVGATVRGRVFEPSGRPAAGATVEVSIERGGTPDFTSMMRRSKAPPIRSDDDGSFVVRGLSKGKGTVTARASAFAPARVAIEVGEGDPAPIEIKLPDTGDLTGRVVDGGGQPIGGAIVTVEGSDAPGGSGAAPYVEFASATAAKDGRFTLKTLPRGVIRIRARANGFKSRAVEATVGSDVGELRLEARGAGDQQRLEEIKTELQGIYMKFASAKGEEQQQLMKRMQALQAEQRELEGGSGTDK